MVAQHCCKGAALGGKANQQINTNDAEVARWGVGGAEQCGGSGVQRFGGVVAGVVLEIRAERRRINFRKGCRLRCSGRALPPALLLTAFCVVSFATSVLPRGAFAGSNSDERRRNCAVFTKSDNLSKNDRFLLFLPLYCCSTATAIYILRFIVCVVVATTSVEFRATLPHRRGDRSDAH